MESRQLEWNGNGGIVSTHYIFHKPRYSLRKRHKQAQYPYNTEDIERQMRQRSPPCLRIGGKRRKIGRYGRTDILTEHKRRSQFKTNPAIGTHNKSYRHCRRGSLHNHGQYRSYQDK